jgi:hypothetical protein
MDRATGLEARRKRLREIATMRRAIEGYRNGQLSLNGLIHALEAGVAEIDDEAFGRMASPIIWDIEQINADSLREKSLSQEDELFVADKLRLLTEEINLTRF